MNFQFQQAQEGPANVKGRHLSFLVIGPKNGLPHLSSCTHTSGVYQFIISSSSAPGDSTAGGPWTPLY